MDPVSQQQITDAFRGATRSEVKRVTFPELDTVDFAKLEFLGWRDKKIPRRAYVCVPTADAADADGAGDAGLVTILLTQAEAKPKTKAMCTWCRDVNITSQAVLYTVRRGGAAGRKGDTIGVLICEDFSCAANARKLPPAFHKATDTDAIREQNLVELRRRVTGFVTEVLSTEE